MVADISMCAERLLAALDSQVDHTIDLHPIMKLVTLDAIAFVSFGRDLELTMTANPETNHIQAAFDAMLEDHFQRVYSPSVLFSNYWMPTPANLRYHRIRNGLRQFVKGIIDDRRALRKRIQKAVEAGETPVEQEHEDLLKHMIRLADEDGQRFTDEDILDDFMTFMCVDGRRNLVCVLTATSSALPGLTRHQQH
jgi:cytochrome P450